MTEQSKTVTTRAEELWAQYEECSRQINALETQKHKIFERWKVAESVRVAQQVRQDIENGK